MPEKEIHADANWDDYAERVVRNEGRLWGLEQLVKETRESDRKLVEQRADSLAQELVRQRDALLELVTARADAVLVLSQTERQADLRESRDALVKYTKNADERWQGDQKAMRLAVDSVASLFNEKIEALEERRIAATEAVGSMVELWRDSEREARELATVETNRRLNALNHADEKRQEFQANAVTRELFNADKEAQTQRETVLRDQIIALDRMMLGMQPAVAAEKVHQDMTARMDAAIAAASMTLDTKINVNSDKINELKSSKDMLAGKSQGATVTIGYLIAVATLVISIVVLFATKVI